MKVNSKQIGLMFAISLVTSAALIYSSNHRVPFAGLEIRRALG